MPSASVPNNFSNNTAADAEEVDANFAALVSYINTNCVLKDASVAFTAVPSGPASDPSSDNQLARKAYVDARVSVRLSKSTTALTTVAATLDGWTEVADASGFYSSGINVVVPSGQAALYAVYLTVDGDPLNESGVEGSCIATVSGVARTAAHGQTGSSKSKSGIVRLGVGDTVHVSAILQDVADEGKTQSFALELLKLS
jgi:hypothetical protein